jgi:hypothetical protein
MPKLSDLWNAIDPYKTFVPLEKHQKLNALQMGALSICSIFFFVYVGFSIDVYAKTPEPSKVTFDRAFPSTPPTALFQFTVMLPLTGTTFTNPALPTQYSSPYSDVLTLKTVVPYKFNMIVQGASVPPGLTVEYMAYTFPVFGTVDPKTLSSILLFFRPAQYINSFPYPLVFSVGPPGVVFSSLDVKVFGDLSSPDILVTDPNSSSQLIILFDYFNSAGPEISIELSLERRIGSDSQVNYKAELFAPPSYSPPSKISTGEQRILTITVKPNVNTIAFTPKNVLAFLGSIGGIFPIFVTAGGIIASLIWLKMQPKTDKIANPIILEMGKA